MKRYWVTRTDDESEYFLWDEKPYWFSGALGYWRGDILCTNGIIGHFCPEDFEALTDIKLKGGPRSIVEITGFKAKRRK